MALVIAKAQMTREKWLESIARIAMADSRRMFEKHGNPLEITDLNDNEAAAIAGFEFFEEFPGSKGERIPVGATRNSNSPISCAHSNSMARLSAITPKKWK